MSVSELTNKFEAVAARLSSEQDSGLEPERLSSKPSALETLSARPSDVGIDDQSRPDEDTVLLGVSCAWLARFCTQHDLWNMTTKQVVESVILPKTQKSKCRFVELQEEFSAEDLGPPSCLISHSWAACFGDLVAAAGMNSPPHRKFWVDIFAVHQHIHDEMASDLKRLQDVIRTSPTGTMVVVNPSFAQQVRQSNPLSRIWCMYEVWQTILNSQPLVVRIGERAEKSTAHSGRDFIYNGQLNIIEKLANEAKLARAEASWVQDKKEILQAIKDSDEGTKTVELCVRSGIFAAYTTRNLPSYDFALQGDDMLSEQIENGLDIEITNPEGWTALHCAASDGFPATVVRLLKFGAKLEAQTPKKRTPLIQAAWNHRHEAVRILLEHGANAQAKDQHGNHAMHYAKTSKENVDMKKKQMTINVLAEFGLDPKYTPPPRVLPDGERSKSGQGRFEVSGRHRSAATATTNFRAPNGRSQEKNTKMRSLSGPAKIEKESGNAADGGGWTQVGRND